MFKKTTISAALTALMASTAIAGGHCAADKTLTEGDLDQISKDIIKVVNEKTGATIRS